MSDHASEYDRADRLLHPDDHVKAENLRVDGGAVEAAAVALLLAMDGDYLPGAGMSIGNESGDVAMTEARPKEVAWWAAEALAAAGLLAASGRAGGGGWKQAESVIVEFETTASRQHDWKGNLSGWQITADDWRAMRAAIRALAADSPADSGAGGGGGG